MFLTICTILTLGYVYCTTSVSDNLYFKNLNPIEKKQPYLKNKDATVFQKVPTKMIKISKNSIYY